jgi:hypothetical protein
MLYGKHVHITWRGLEYSSDHFPFVGVCHIKPSKRVDYFFPQLTRRPLLLSRTGSVSAKQGGSAKPSIKERLMASLRRPKPQTEVQVRGHWRGAWLVAAAAWDFW